MCEKLLTLPFSAKLTQFSEDSPPMQTFRDSMHLATEKMLGETVQTVS